MAVDALGADRVHGVMLPYTFTSNESLTDAAETAEALARPLRHHADPRRGRGPEPRASQTITDGGDAGTPRRRICSRVPAARC